MLATNFYQGANPQSRLREETISPNDLIKLTTNQLSEVQASQLNPRQYLEIQRLKDKPVQMIQESGFFQRPKAERYRNLQIFLPNRGTQYSDLQNSVRIPALSPERFRGYSAVEPARLSPARQTYYTPSSGMSLSLMPSLVRTSVPYGNVGYSGRRYSSQWR